MVLSFYIWAPNAMHSSEMKGQKKWRKKKSIWICFLFWVSIGPLYSNTISLNARAIQPHNLNSDCSHYKSNGFFAIFFYNGCCLSTRYIAKHFFLQHSAFQGEMEKQNRRIPESKYFTAKSDLFSGLYFFFFFSFLCTSCFLPAVKLYQLWFIVRE